MAAVSWRDPATSEDITTNGFAAAALTGSSVSVYRESGIGYESTRNAASASAPRASDIIRFLTLPITTTNHRRPINRSGSYRGLVTRFTRSRLICWARAIWLEVICDLRKSLSS